MSGEATKTIVPAQPGYFRLWPYADEAGGVTYRKDAIIAWCVTVEPHPDPDHLGSVSAFPVTTSPEGDSMYHLPCILRPDGYVDEFEEPLRSLDDWLKDSQLLKRNRWRP